MALNKEFKIFVSHGKQDTWLASQIAQRIEQCGASSFLDVKDINKGDNFKEVVHYEITRCKELVALFTPWSSQRSWVWVEIGAAWGQGKRIVAVLYGLTTADLEKIGGSKAVLEDINIVYLNDLEQYLSELNARISEI